MPDEAPTSFKPRSDADPLTDVERAAVRKDAVLLDEWKKQEERMILRTDVVANDNALEAERQMVVNMSRGVTRPPTGQITPQTHGAYVRPRPTSSKPSGGARADPDTARRRGILEIFASRQSAANEAQQAHLADDLDLGIRPTPGGKGMGANVDAGNLMHYFKNLGVTNITYAEAFQAHPVSNPRIPPEFASDVANGRVIPLRDLPPDLRAEFWLGATQRADRVSVAERVIFELKPDSAAAMRKGLRQAAGYARLAPYNRLLTKDGAPWQYVVVVYNAAEARKFVTP